MCSSYLHPPASPATHSSIGSRSCQRPETDWQTYRLPGTVTFAHNICPLPERHSRPTKILTKNRHIVRTFCPPRRNGVHFNTATNSRPTRRANVHSGTARPLTLNYISIKLFTQTRNVCKLRLMGQGIHFAMQI